MNCDSVKRRPPWNRRVGATRRRGLTLLEVLAAVAITMAFLGGAVLAFNEMMRTTDRSEVRLEAVSNARTALNTISRHLIEADPGVTGNRLFSGKNSDLTTGNGVDDDQDGNADEEIADGLDDDGDWTAASDRHTTITPVIWERNRYHDAADLGDARVDEDTLFVESDLAFRTEGTTGPREVRFYMGTYQGDSNVLIQEMTEDVGGPDERTTTGPLAFNVVSFSTLFWDQAESKYWVRDWDAEAPPPGGPALPAAVNLSITVYAGATQDLSSAVPGSPIETVTLTTTVYLERVLGDPAYASIRETY